MDERVALLGIIVEESDAVQKINTLLHEYRHIIIGRMGIPYEKKGVSIISVVVDGPMNDISSLSGKLGRISGVNVKAQYTKTV